MSFGQRLAGTLIGITAVVMLVQLDGVSAQSAQQVRAIAERITVRIDGPGKERNNGSGVLVSRQGNTYTVLTAGHVVDSDGTYTLQLFDREKYSISSAQVRRFPGLDLAMVQFVSARDYQVAERGRDDLDGGATLYAAGWYNQGAVVTERIFDTSRGRLVNRINQPKEGYSLIYTLEVAQPGMSGGPILNDQGQLVGINGIAQRDLRTGNIDLLGGIPISTFWRTAPQLYYSEGKRNLERGQYNEALANFEQVLQFDSKSVDAYLGRAYARFLQRNYQGVIEDSNWLLQQKPGLNEAIRLQGAALAKKGDHQAAVETFSRLLQGNSRTADLYALRAISYARLSNFKQAYQDANQALSSDPTNVFGLLSRSLIRSIAGDEQGYREDLQQVQQRFPQAANTDVYELAILQQLNSTSLETNPVTPPSISRPEPISRPTLPSPRPPSSPVPSPPSPVTPLDSNWLTAVAIQPDITMKAGITALVTGVNNNLMAIGDRIGDIEIRDQTTQRNQWSLNAHFNEVKALAFHPNGNWLASGGIDTTVKVWSTRTGRSSYQFRQSRSVIYALTFSRTGQTLGIGAGEGKVWLWDWQSNQVFLTIDAHAAPVSALAFSPDGKFLATGSHDRTIKIWQLNDRTATLLYTLTGHTGVITSIAFAPDGRTLISSSEDKSIRLWSLENQSAYRTLTLNGSVWKVEFGANGQIFAGAFNNGIGLWSFPNGELLSMQLDPDGPVRAIAFNTTSRKLITGGDARKIKLWQVAEASGDARRIPSTPPKPAVMRPSRPVPPPLGGNLPEPGSINTGTATPSELAAQRAIQAMLQEQEQTYNRRRDFVSRPYSLDTVSITGYSFAARTTTTAAYHYAIPRSSNFKAYVGMIFFNQRTNSFLNIVCESSAPGSVRPADPRLTQDQLVCNSGTNQLAPP